LPSRNNTSNRLRTIQDVDTADLNEIPAGAGNDLE